MNNSLEKLFHPRMVDLVIGGLLFVLVMFFLPRINVGLSNNSAYYLDQAKQIYMGESLAENTGVTQRGLRGYAFPFSIAMVFEVFGKEVPNALIISRFFYFASIFLCYLFCRIRLSPLYAAFIIPLILSSSELMVLANTIDTDIVVPFFVLAAIGLLYQSIEKEKSLFAALAGVTFGIGLLFKESILPLIVVPFLAAFLLQRGEKKRALRAALAYIPGALLIIVPWVAWVWAEFGDPILAMGHANPTSLKKSATVLRESSAVWYFTKLFTVDLFPSLAMYYTGHLMKITALAPVVVVSWVFFILNSLRQRKRLEIVFVASLLGFMPLVVYVGNAQYRPGQTVFVYYLSYMVLLFESFRLIRYLTRKRSVRLIPATRGAFFLLSGAFILVQVGDTLVERGLDKVLAKFTQNKTVQSRITKDHKKAAEWIVENLSGYRIAADGYTNEGIEFHMPSGEKVDHFKLEVHRITVEGKGSNLEERLMTPLEPDPTFFFTYIRFRKNRPDLFFVYEKDIQKSLVDAGLDYVAISGRGSFLRYYFEETKWAKEVFSSGQVHIYRINREGIRNISSRLQCKNERFVSDLEWFKKHNRENYDQLEKVLGRMKITVATQTSETCTLPYRQTY